jgi:hypothetical protein
MIPILLLAWALPHFQPQTIAEDLRGGYQVVAVDLNHDGKPDLIALASGMDELVWYENPSWQRHVIARGLKRMINLAAMDTDGDGVPELLVAHEFANEAAKSIGIVSLLHSNGDPRELWSVKEIDRLPTSHRLRIADIDGSGHKVFLNAPLTGANAAPPDYRGHAPLVFYRPGEWKREVIGDENEGVQHGIYIVPGKKGDTIITASFSGIDEYAHGKRTEVSKGDPSPCPKCGSSDVAVTNDGLVVAIEPWHGNQVVVYRKGKREVIDDQLVDGHSIITADLDGDGKDEIIVAQRGKPYRVLMFHHQGKQWQRSVIDEGGLAGAACTAADLDADGRNDLACIGSATHNLKVYWNRR